MKLLILGKAKTGTTIIAKTVQANLSRARLLMEPMSPDDLSRCDRFGLRDFVVKVIFEHWSSATESRNSLVHNELIVFDKLICTLRDPRDEIISRLIYFVFPWSQSHPGNRQKIKTWIELIKQKEQDPSSLSLIDLTSELKAIFGFNFLGQLNLLKVYSNFLAQLPDNAYLLRYEDFIRNDIGPLENYLGFPLKKRASNRKFRYTKRTASLNNWKQFLLPEDVEFLKSNFGDQIEQFGYTDWDLDTPASLPGEHYSGYIEKLLSVKKRPRWMRRQSR